MSENKFVKPLSQARLAADIVIFTLKDDKLQVLLVERSSDPFIGLLALPGGFLWENETSLESAQRTLKTKAGVEDVFIEQLYTFDALNRDPRGNTISIIYYTLIPYDRLIIHKASDTLNSVLTSIDELPNLAFDHNEIISYALGRLRSKISYSNAIFSLLPDLFTFAQLQSAYEAVLGTKLDKRNFRKKYMSLNLIEITEERLGGTSYRPPQLFQFKDKSPRELPSAFM